MRCTFSRTTCKRDGNSEEGVDGRTKVRYDVLLFGWREKVYVKMHSFVRNVPRQIEYIHQH